MSQLLPLANDLIIYNDYATELLNRAQVIIDAHPGFQGAEDAIRRCQGDIRAEIVCITHTIARYLRTRELLVNDLKRLAEYDASPVVEIEGDTPVAADS